MKHPLDDKLSDAQRVLRDGYHDHLSRAVADARDLLNNAVPGQRGEVLVATVKVHTVGGSTFRMLLITRSPVDVSQVICDVLPPGFRVQAVEPEEDLVAPTGFLLG